MRSSRIRDVRESLRSGLPVMIDKRNEESSQLVWIHLELLQSRIVLRAAREWENEEHNNPLGTNFARRAARGSGSDSRNCSSWLTSRRQFPALHGSPRILRDVLPRSALGVPADRIPFHSAWDVGRSGRGADLRWLDARAA